MYGFEYKVAKDQNETITQLNEFYKVSKQPVLLEIFTPSKINDKILLEYFKFIK